MPTLEELEEQFNDYKEETDEKLEELDIVKELLETHVHRGIETAKIRYKDLLDKLLYGEISAHGLTDAITSVAQNDWDQIVAFDTNGESNGTTPDHTNNHITINKDGKYLISFIWCGYGPAAAHDWDFHISKNSNASQFENLTAHQTTPTTQKTENATCAGIADLKKNDTIELWVKRTSAGNNIVLTTVHCILSILQIGD